MEFPGRPFPAGATSSGKAESFPASQKDEQIEKEKTESR
jgi:hypothetical protein